MASFVIGDTDFMLDGSPHRILSGAIHYFRVHPDDWSDRIRAARLMGLNAIETYVAWNEHAPQRGEFQLSGRLDLGRFLDTVAGEGMHAIVRPGPYICAEFDNGGLPAWLTRIPGIGLRRNEPAYLEAVTDYFAHLAPVLVPRQIEAGGPIILVQIENEYGAYGDDSDYLRELIRLVRDVGITVPLTTIDQPTDEMLTAGGIPELHKTASFGSDAASRLTTLRRHQPTGPLMCAEFWDGWFDSWGLHHHTTSARESARELDAVLSAGASVNIYMFHGGTNFGLTNGANHKGRYVPITTSYDYDAPLDESGHPTEKYWAFREVLARYAPVPEEVPSPATDAPSFGVPFAQSEPLLSVLDRIARTFVSTEIPDFDDIEHDRGIAVYRTTLTVRGAGVLRFTDVRDRAWVKFDGVSLGVLSREAHERTIVLPNGSGLLEVLVEDQGRVNYGLHIGERKGIIGPVTLDEELVSDWILLPVDLELLPQVALRSESGSDGALVARAQFSLEAPSSIYLDTSAWGKGFAWVNGFNLGRYWRRGPQQTLFVPRSATIGGVNEITVLELEVLGSSSARFISKPGLGPVEE